MFKVTNKAKDVRKFRDKISGKDVFVEPGKSVLAVRSPEENNVWKIEEVIEKIDDKKIKTKEDDVNDSSSS